MILVGNITKAPATNLLQVYRQAQASDPTYKRAKSTYMSARSKLPQARAAFLPNLNLESSQNKTVDRSRRYLSPTNQFDATLSLNQSLFDLSKLKNYKEIKLDVKSAAADYGVAMESLIMRTATAYFTILKDLAVLDYSMANVRQLYSSLQIAMQRYKVGLDTITSVYDARSSYALAKASYLAAENKLASDKEALWQITGQFYRSLAKLKESFPLVKPAPASIDEWAKAAEQHNLSLMAARYHALATKENIKATSARKMATLRLNGNYNYTHDYFRKSEYYNSTIGVTLNVPLYQGGLYSAETKTAEYNYQIAVAATDQTHRKILAEARNAYLELSADISKIKADKLAINSAKASLASNEASYQVGTKTIADVLSAQAKLYQSQQNYTSDLFDHIINTFKLKKAVGILGVNDLRQVNLYLTNVPNSEAHNTKHEATSELKKQQNLLVQNKLLQQDNSNEESMVLEQDAAKEITKKPPDD